jgi:hypothetical protein
LYSDYVKQITKLHASGKTVGTGQFQSSTDDLYNEFNVPHNSDWAIVLKFVMDRFFISGIPAYYLIPDSSYLPDEAIRFFHIDQSWLDALIDGVLSLANQLEADDDDIRRAIKEHINNYLKAPLDSGHVPQIPKYGFLLRSKVVQVYPDLKVTAAGLRAGDSRTPTPFLQRIADDVLLAMFDRAPNDVDFHSLTIQQPPHQLSFSLGTSLTHAELDMTLRYVWTVPQPNGSGSWGEIITDRDGKSATNVYTPDTFVGTDETPQLYDWKYNTIIMTNYVTWVKRRLWELQPEHFGFMDEYNPAKPSYQTNASSAIIGLQLNEPLWYLTMQPLNTQGTLTQSPRQLWIVPQTSPAITKTNLQTTVAMGPTNPTLAERNMMPAGNRPLPERPPVSPRSPNLQRIHANDSSYAALPASKGITTLNLDFQCGIVGHPTNSPTDPIPVTTVSPVTLVFSIRYTGEQESIYRLHECIIELPLDVQNFRFPVLPSQIPASQRVPFLSAQVPVNINVGKGVIGNGQSWCGVVLERTPKCLLLKFVPVRAVGIGLVPGMSAGCLVKEAALAGRTGCCLVRVTCVWDVPDSAGGFIATRGVFHAFFGGGGVEG